MRKNIYERRSDLERQKIALLGKEKALKEKERKARTTRLIEWGGLIAKAKLEHLDTHTLYGALLDLQHHAKNPDSLKQWSQRGQAAFIRQQQQDNTVPLVVQFTDKPSPNARIALRSLGLRWNSIRQEWQGISELQAVEQVAQKYGGKVVMLNP